MRKKLLPILVLSFLLASTSVDCGSSPSTLTVISATEGNVDVVRGGTASWIEAQIGMSLEVGDRIKTGGDSSAEITFFDGSTTELQADTEIEIALLDISADAGPTTVTLEQTIGTTVSRVTKLLDPASRYEVETPTGVVAVRGTVVQVCVTEDGTTRAAVLEGEVWVTGEGAELQITEGQECIVRPDQPPELVAEVAFADPNLEAAVRDAIAIPTGLIYSSDIDELTHLDASDRNITDLTGLEYATSLTTLDLVNNQIDDISPLAGLTSLTGLWLLDNQISDVSPLAGLTNLAGLGLNRNQIADISPLVGLTNLTLGLWLAHNQISDVSPLANLSSLAILELGDNGISQVSPLADLTSLTELYLWDNEIGDISPLVQNAGLGAGDIVDLELNPLSSDSITTYIPQLEARGVIVSY
jgi:Leucine-rich repeat (LRR) protein